MKLIPKYLYVLTLIGLLASCSSSDSADKDLEKPTITINYADGFPTACTELKRGETYNFRAMVTDNQALASYSLDLHNNFDHHTHDDQDETCETDAIKDAVNPLIYMENFAVEADLTSYEINISVNIPNDIDTGDYHCSYTVTDETGWQSITSVDIKIVE